MIKFYANQIRLGKITIEQVPAKWREAVQAMLDEVEETKE